MPYLIVVYDMDADRTDKPRKLLRRHLQHVQFSVFEGSVTEGNAEEIKQELNSMLNEGESAIVYEHWSEQYVDRTVVGDDPMDDARFL